MSLQEEINEILEPEVPTTIVEALNELTRAVRSAQSSLWGIERVLTIAHRDAIEADRARVKAMRNAPANTCV